MTKKSSYASLMTQTLKQPLLNHNATEEVAAATCSEVTLVMRELTLTRVALTFQMYAPRKKKRNRAVKRLSQSKKLVPEETILSWM